MAAAAGATHRSSSMAVLPASAEGTSEQPAPCTALKAFPQDSRSHGGPSLSTHPRKPCHTSSKLCASLALHLLSLLLHPRPQALRTEWHSGNEKPGHPEPAAFPALPARRSSPPLLREPKEAAHVPHWARRPQCSVRTAPTVHRAPLVWAPCLYGVGCALLTQAATVWAPGASYPHEPWHL